MIFTFCVVAIPAVCFDFYYDLNDDTVIKDILSGAYTGVPSGYSIQMLYPLSWLIASAYKVMPEMPWFGVFLCCCQFGVLMLAAWRLWGAGKNGNRQNCSIGYRGGAGSWADIKGIGNYTV